MPLDAELAEIRDFLASRGVDVPADRLALTFRPRGSRLAPTDEVVAVRSGAVGGGLVVTDDALLVVRPAPVSPEVLRLLAVDVETTGLVAGHDRVVAVGWVPVDGDRLDLAGARRFVVRGDDPGAAAGIHGLTHDDLATGTPLRDVLRELRAALDGRALLAHHATFDRGFLRAAYREVGERMPRRPVVCTLTLQKRLLRGDHLAEWPEGALKLWVARERYGLPSGREHDALGDALACAELYLGQAAELGRGRRLTLRDVRMPTGWPHRARRWMRRRWWRARRRALGVSSASR
ncbi:3'-5' exonuclease [Nocardioides sp. GXQ0305]|uniref:3'-5' exonuclease n=1 Tax=Nocardioides sp. GXQ0305 TaxID=3423912 RepID=UPI003D7C73EF